MPYAISEEYFNHSLVHVKKFWIKILLWDDPAPAISGGAPLGEAAGSKIVRRDICRIDGLHRGDYSKAPAREEAWCARGGRVVNGKDGGQS